MKKIVCIGGGTGTYQVLSGLKKLPVEITAVISMCDSGGSTGKLRQELGILPPGDVRRAILALSDLPFAYKTLEEVFEFRFNGKNGNMKGGLAGHSLGNILLAALVQITGSMDKAISEAARILNASGKIYPVTLDKTNLVAILGDGTRVWGETNIDMRNFKLDSAIKKVFLTPKAKVFKDAAMAIQNADLIVLGPGDLYTSIIPSLLISGVNEAIINSNAKLIYVTNLMTKRGETDNFKASDFVFQIEKYLGNAKEKLSHVLISKKVGGKKKEMDKWYKHYGSIPVVNNLEKSKNYKIIEKDFVDSTTFYRHDSEKISKTLMNILDE
jgi:uncharacterized cofD-like protein